MRRLHVLALIALTVVGVLASAVSAQAAPTDPWVYKYTFGEGSSFNYTNIAVNHQTGNVLIMGSDGKIHQFDGAGNPVNFPATGSPEISVAGKMAIANGGGPTQGNFYVWDGTFLHSYRADGSEIGTYQPYEEGVFAGEFPFSVRTAGIFTGADGTLWVFNEKIGPFGGNESAELVAVTPEAVPVGPRGEISSFFLWRGPPPILDE